MKTFRTYPTINDVILKKIKYKQNNKFKFNNNLQGTKDNINIDDSETTIEFIDQNKRWFYKKNDLIIEKEIILNTKPLFGNSGVAEEDSELGVAIKWMSKKSMIRGMEDVGSFSIKSETFQRKGTIYFNENQIRDSLTYEVVLYLKKNGYKNRGRSIFADVPGTILGILESKTLNFAGRGSTFPIVNVKDSKLPLWKLEIINFDPSLQVDEAIVLLLNEDHKKYHLFEQETYNEFFVEEVMINVVYQLLLYEKKYEIYDDNYEEGTLGSLINYYKKVYTIKDNNDPNELYASISKELRK